MLDMYIQQINGNVECLVHDFRKARLLKWCSVCVKDDRELKEKKLFRIVPKINTEYF